MTHSLNEIEATAKRAARGAGLSWGIAEEAAKDARLVEMPSVSLGGVKRGFNSLLPEAQALYEAAVSYMNSDQAELERLQTKLSTLRGAERDLEVENQELRRGISITALEAAEAPG